MINEDVKAFQAAINALEKQDLCDNAVSRQAVPLDDAKTGHWIKYQKPWGGMQCWKCSNCKNHYDISDSYTMIPYNYCPNCGSRMMEAENDE